MIVPSPLVTPGSVKSGRGCCRRVGSCARHVGLEDRAGVPAAIWTLNGIPKIVFYPILLTIFGLSGASQVTMGVMFGSLPVVVNVMAGITEMPPIYRKLARTLEVPRRTALFRVYLRSAVPKVMVALQLGFALSSLGVVYGELIASTNGIGQRANVRTCGN